MQEQETHEAGSKETERGPPEFSHTHTHRTHINEVGSRHHTELLKPEKRERERERTPPPPFSPLACRSLTAPSVTPLRAAVAAVAVAVAAAATAPARC